MQNQNKISKYGRIFITGFLVVQMFFGFLGGAQVNVAQAQTIPDAINSSDKPSIDVPEYSGVQDSIRDYLCVPDDDNLGTALFDCISKVYRFGIAFGAIALVFFVVFAGYLYMAGGESGKERGKTMFTTALTGMAVILSSYVLLRFINPDLVKIKPIQTPIFTASNLPKCEEVGFGVACVLPSGQVAPSGPPVGTPGSGAGSCKVMSSGACSTQVLSSCPDWNASDASRVCNLESNGGANLTIASGSDKCTDGTSFSYGLWQINLTVHQGQPYMPAACQKKIFTGTNFACRLTASKADLQACVTALGDAYAQTKVACGLYKGRGGNFMDWMCSAHRCQIPNSNGSNYSRASSSKFCQTFPPR